MSDKRPRRESVTVRLAPAALTELETIAAERDTGRSQVIRDLLRLGLSAWKKGQR